MLLLLIALALPWVLDALGMGYYLSLASRVLVYAIAASSLNLVLGYGGMVSFGHAAFVGLGAYVTGIMISEGIASGGAHLLATALSPRWRHWSSAIRRTRGVYFIMITLALRCCST
jgi:branched-chain amino acid transport system permease protein